jgi:hypothetical protein
MRTHISLPEDLLQEIDELVGARKRSAFIEDAVRRRMVNERQRQMLNYLDSLPPLPDDDPSWGGLSGVEWEDKIRAEELAIERERGLLPPVEDRYDNRPRPPIRRVAEG